MIDRGVYATKTRWGMAPLRSFSVSHGPVTSELFVRLATLLNDFNPAHYDASFAQGAGLPGVIGPGTLIQGWVLVDVETHLEPASGTDDGGEPHTVRAIDLRLKAPFMVGDVVDIAYDLDGDMLTATATVAGDETARTVATATVRLGPAT